MDEERKKVIIFGQRQCFELPSVLQRCRLGDIWSVKTCAQRRTKKMKTDRELATPGSAGKWFRLPPVDVI